MRKLAATLAATMERVNSVAILASGCLVLIMMVLTLVDILRRTLALYIPELYIPKAWSVEFGEAALLVMTYLGMAYLLSKNRHVAVDLVRSWAHGKAAAIWDVTICFVVFCFAVLITWRGGYIAWDYLLSGKLTPDGFPLYMVTLFIPIGGFMLALQALVEILSRILPGEG